MLSKNHLNFFKVALWLPLVALLALMLVEQIIGNSVDLEWRQVLSIYVLALGTPAYLVFALWAMRSMDCKTEQLVLRRVWRAPLMFIPFYAVPWLVYGLANLLTGDFAGFAMMFGWVAFLPYLLIAGYTVSGLTVALYRTVFS